MDRSGQPDRAGPAVLLISHRALAGVWTLPLEAAGYTVILHDRPDPHTYRWIRDDQPAAIIRDTAAPNTLPLLAVLQRSRWANAIPIVTADAGSAVDVAAALK